LHEQVQLQPNWEFTSDGPSLAGVLDRLRDLAPERFEALNLELHRLIPEFDRVLFDTPAPGYRSFLLRTCQGQHPIPARDVSQGTLLALAILTLAHLPNPPPVIGLEEPDRGIHPRLLRELQDALYRLAYPEQLGETRAPVQVIATTQSPYFLDLFKDHPEEIVIAEKTGLEATFSKLSERPDIEEILADAALGEVWYSGVLGGVPQRP
jgi:predicted ATPase